MDINSDRAASNFIVPLSMEFVRNLTGREQVELFVKALRLTVYGGTVTHLEWYETQAIRRYTTGNKRSRSSCTIHSNITGRWDRWNSVGIISYRITNFSRHHYSTKTDTTKRCSEWLKAVAMIAYVAAMFYAGGGFNAISDCLKLHSWYH